MSKCKCKDCAFNVNEFCHICRIEDKCVPNDKNCPMYDFQYLNYFINSPITTIGISILTTLVFHLLLLILQSVL